MYLQSWGIRASAVQDGDEALRRLRQASSAKDPYQVAIVDLVMPGMSGTELATKIQADATIADTTLILLTASDRKIPVDQASKLGFKAYLGKPVKQGYLLDVLLRAAGLDDTNPKEGDLRLPAPDSRFDRFGLILLVEDHPANQMVAQLQLKELGLSAHVANNGKEALEAVAKTVYDVILMDCQMPEMDGYEATGAIRKAEALTGIHTPIIAMTAHAMEHARNTCLAAGMDDYLSKPVELEELQVILERWLPKARRNDSSSAPKLNEQTTTSQTSGLTSTTDAAREAQKTYLSQFSNRYGRESLEGLMSVFVSETLLTVTALRQAVSDQNALLVQNAAHKLAGSCAVIRANEMSELSKRLETSASQCDWALSQGLADQIESAFERAKKIIAEVLAEAEDEFKAKAK